MSSSTPSDTRQRIAFRKDVQLKLEGNVLKRLRLPKSELFPEDLRADGSLFIFLSPPLDEKASVILSPEQRVLSGTIIGEKLFQALCDNAGARERRVRGILHCHAIRLLPDGEFFFKEFPKNERTGGYKSGVTEQIRMRFPDLSTLESPAKD